MSFFIFLYFSFLLFLFHPASSRQPLCHASERSALLRFKESLSLNRSASHDPSAYSKTALWNLEEDGDCCLWDGVKCNEDTGYVIELDLSSSCLYGSINSTSTLFNLVHLQWLSLADNYFSDFIIPSGIMNLSSLLHLNLSHSYFSGQIPPEMLQLSNLEYLDLAYNYDLELQHPGLESLVEKLINLKVLDLYSVNISSSLPQLLTNLSSLEFLSLRFCELEGNILSSIHNLNNLVHLDLSHNNLQGQIPSEMLELSQLEYLDLSRNLDSLEKTLQLRQPCGLRSLVEKLTNLKWLDLSWVNISSPLPNSLGNLSSLTHLYLFDCNLQGTIPSSIGNLTKLVHLDISYNNFRDELPISIANLGSLQVLDFSGNQLSSQTLSSLGNLTQLNTLSLHGNNFSNGNSSSLSWIAKQTKLTNLYLFGANLAGEIPFWLLNLTHLSRLSMGNNHLTGPIPFWLMNLNQLSYLSFGSNQLTGQIPFEISNLTQLIDLDLSLNRLTGQIPFEISNLTQLIDLDLSLNRLHGPIPISIFELKNLQYLDLYSNRLNGTVELDTYLLKFKSLERLILSSNHFSVLTENTVNATTQQFSSIGLGSCNLTIFPDFLKNQYELSVLDLSSNNIPGQIPGWLLNVSKINLESLNLSYNLLTGFDQHPVVLPLTNLKTLDLRWNKLQGSLPLPASSTSIFLASNNKLTGEIPPRICKLNQLKALDLSYNNLSGVLPQCLGNFSNYLSILGLQSNDFSGSIPLFVSESFLRMIDLSHNKLQGKIPRSFANCTSLEFLNLGYNQITDAFPSWLGILPELKVVILTSNKFHGVLSQPKTNFKFSKLQIIDLSHNLFTGELPSKYFQSWNSMKVVNGSQLSYMEKTLFPSSFGGDYFDFPSYAYTFMMNNKGIELAYEKISNQLTSISLSGNKFTGEIPTSISNIKALKNLNLSNNNFFGHIPSSLSNLTELESLDLSNNKLFGEIPHQLAELNYLEIINVAHNNLKGRIPEGTQFNTFENISFVGNPGLCGKPLSKKCEQPEDLKKGDQGSSESKFAFDWKIVLIGFVSGLVVGVILGNEFFTNITEWFAMTFEMQLMRVKRRRGHRN